MAEFGRSLVDYGRQSGLGWLREKTPELLPKADPSRPNIVLLGSFRNWDGLMAARLALERYGLAVLAPDAGKIVEPDGFALIDADKAKVDRITAANGGNPPNKWDRGVLLEALFLAAIKTADACYVIPSRAAQSGQNGYYGITVASEIGYALGLEKPLYTADTLSDELDGEQASVLSGFPSNIPILGARQLAMEMRAA